MKRPGFILLAGIVLAVAAYFGFYFGLTARSRSLADSQEPELQWLKNEFHIADRDFARISEMHDSYRGGCAQRCRLIDERNQELKRLLAHSTSVTPEIEKALAETARLHAECQLKMLQHFYEVSRTMPPEQGERYLTWVTERTILPDTHSQMQH
jgi:hypothetical protein